MKTKLKLTQLNFTRNACILFAGMTGLSSLTYGADSLDTWISEGKPSLTLNPRFEYGDTTGLDVSRAATLKTLLGYTTGDWIGFKALVEFNNTTALDYDDYNGAGLNGQGGKTPIADPETTEVNQVYLSYGIEMGSLTVGRQRIILDNARMIGNVGWRQNEQTYDAIKLSATPVDGLTLTGIYIDEVNRIFSDARDWDSESFLFNANYKVSKALNVTGYYYYYDLVGAGAPADEVDTYGLIVKGSVSIDDDLSINYYLEGATQDYLAVNPTYYHAVLGTAFKGFSLDFGYEVLGSDAGAGQFLTPLATAHKFNGFADAYLDNGGANGLEDFYIKLGAKFGKLSLTAVYHDFSSEEGSARDGDEFDFVAVYPITKSIKALGKVALYESDTGTETDRYILQVTYTY